MLFGREAFFVFQADPHFGLPAFTAPELQRPSSGFTLLCGSTILSIAVDKNGPGFHVSMRGAVPLRTTIRFQIEASLFNLLQKARTTSLFLMARETIFRLLYAIGGFQIHPWNLFGPCLLLSTYEDHRGIARTSHSPRGGVVFFRRWPSRFSLSFL